GQRRDQRLGYSAFGCGWRRDRDRDRRGRQYECADRGVDLVLGSWSFVLRPSRVLSPSKVLGPKCAGHGLRTRAAPRTKNGLSTKNKAPRTRVCEIRSTEYQHALRHLHAAVHVVRVFLPGGRLESE